MWKILQIVASLATALPLKIMEAAKDKIITVSELFGITKTTLKSLGYDQARLARMGVKEAAVIQKVADELKKAIADREITLEEALAIVENVILAAGLSEKAVVDLSK